MTFIFAAVALCAIAVLALLAPLWSARRRSAGVGVGIDAADSDEHRAVVALIRIRLDELAREYADGLLDQSAYEQLKLEQQRRLLEESVVASRSERRRGAGLLLVVIAVLVPLAALLIYAQLGASGDWQVQQLVERTQRATSPEQQRNLLSEMAPLLTQQIERHGDDQGRRRFLLARVDMELGNAAAAAEQYGLLAAQFPQDAALAAQHAQASYLANGRQLTPALRAEAERALQLDPNQPTALGLLGIAALERGDYAAALQHWRKLLAQLPADSPNAQVIADGIRRAESEAAAAGIDTAPAEVAGPRVVATVAIADALKEQIPSGATLFIFVRAKQGPPMPLAAVRQPVGAQWPVTVELSDAQSMAPGVNLSSLLATGGAGELVARITASGQVRPQPGDLEGSVALALTAGEQQITVVIEHKL